MIYVWISHKLTETPHIVFNDPENKTPKESWIKTQNSEIQIRTKDQGTVKEWCKESRKIINHGKEIPQVRENVENAENHRSRHEK